MPIPTQQLTAANFARIFVALQRALSITRPRDPNSALLRGENTWALAVLLGERAYSSTNPPEDDYRLAIRTLGPLAGEGQQGPIWPVVVEAGDAADRAESLRAAEKLAAQLARVGIDLIAGLATPARLAAFRDAAQRISPQPNPLPTLDSLFGADVDRDALPAIRAATPIMRAGTGKGVVRVLVYGLPVLGGLSLIAGAISFVKKRGVHRDGR